jgi:hypothetical protein
MRNEKDLLIRAAKLTLTKGKKERAIAKVSFWKNFIAARYTCNVSRAKGDNLKTTFFYTLLR